jgi:hypothetical protein
MEGTKSVYKWKREERRERERKCVITLGRHNTLHDEPRLKISTEHACTCKTLAPGQWFFFFFFCGGEISPNFDLKIVISIL